MNSHLGQVYNQVFLNLTRGEIILKKFTRIATGVSGGFGPNPECL